MMRAVLTILLILCLESEWVYAQDGLMFGADEIQAQEPKGYCNDEYQWTCADGECIVSEYVFC